jgi:replicative DNA helicase
MQRIRDLMGEVVEAMNNTNPGLPTGLTSLDKATRGISPGQFVTIAGRSSMGKTALAGDLILAQQVPVLFFSLEMSAVIVVQRMAANLANVNFRKMQDGNLNEKEHTRVKAALADLNDREIYIDDTPCLLPEQFDQKADQCPQAQLIVLDYLQLMKHSDGRLNETQALDQICQSLNAYIKTRKRPLVLLSQLNRKPDEREGHEPRLADLRGSGGIEQVSDVVLLLHRPAYYLQREIDVETDDDGEAWIIIGKQRNGVTGKIKSAFIGEFMSFRDTAQEDMSRWV